MERGDKGSDYEGAIERETVEKEGFDVCSRGDCSICCCRRRISIRVLQLQNEALLTAWVEKRQDEFIGIKTRHAVEYIYK